MILIYFGRTKPRIAAISKRRDRPCEDDIIRIEDNYPALLTMARVQSLDAPTLPFGSRSAPRSCYGKEGL